MQHYAVDNHSYTSLQRQQKLSNDINSIILLISAYKKSLKNNTSHKNPITIGQKTFLSNKINQSQILLSQKDKQYAEYGIKFLELTYQGILYLLCRKQILYEFIFQFIKDKYQIKNLPNFHQKLTENIKEIYHKNQPQISLSSCISSNWIDVFSKQDIFEDVLDLFKSNVSKNWKVNQIKTQKKLQNSTLINNQTKIFQTQPNLQTIQINKSNTKKDKTKQVIQQSTRNILKGLQRLKREMQQCQAEMNMAKNNDNKILQKNNQYSNKKKQFNQLKEQYRKRTNKQQNEFRKIQKINAKNIVNSTNTLKQADNNIIEKKGKNQNDENLKQKIKNQLIKQGSQLLKIPENKEQAQPIYQIKQNQDEIQNQSVILDQKPIISIKEYDELIDILDKVNKNQQKNLRIQALKTVQNQQKNNLENKIKKFKKNRTQSLLNSSKQQFLDKYVKRVFNHYILQQSKMKPLSLFDKSLSGSQLNHQSITLQNQKRRSEGVSPLMRKKFSTEIEESVHIEPKRRMSLVTPGKIQSRNERKDKLRQRMKTIGNNLPQHSFITKQPQLSLESYSKFAKAFQLGTKNVSLAQILQLFKKKSQNKKSVTYNQFLQLFELIYILECQKMEIEFTPLMFDNYLKKQIFSWEKINKVLRLKTIEVSKNGSSQMKDQNNEVKSRYKFSLVGHSGRLSEQIMQKINSNKKPVDKMPCMSRNKTTPVNFEEEFPKTRIQIKIEEIKRLKQIQKARKKQQLQSYLQQSRMAENSQLQFQPLKNAKNQQNKSYSKRYRMIESRKKQTHDIMNNFSKANNSKLINLRKLIENSNRYSANESDISRNVYAKYSSKNILQTEQNIENQTKHKKRTQTLQPSHQTIESQKYLNEDKQTKMSKQIQSQQEIKQLQKIIGIRQSDQESQYSQQFQDHLSPIVNEKQPHSQIQQKSLYQTIDHSQKLIPFAQSIKTTEKELQSEENNSRKHKSKNKNKQPKQEDQFLANYFSKQQNHISPIRYRHQTNQNQELQSLQNGRQNWKIHF